MSEHIGQVIKRLREERHLSKARLAREAGFSDAYLVQIEKGDRNPSESVLCSIAKALKVPPHVLLIPAGHYDERDLNEAQEQADRVRALIEADRGGPLTQEECDRLLDRQLEYVDRERQYWKLMDDPKFRDAEEAARLREEDPLALTPEEYWQWNEADAWAPEHWNNLSKRDRTMVQELINRLVELADQA